jgi:EamA-like transporter family
VTLAAAVARPPRHVTAGAVLGLAYVGLVPMCLGFFAWYDGLARGGVARIGRLQLAQPALTLGWSALLLGEHVSWLTAGAAAAVIVVTAVGRNARVDRPLLEPGRDVAVGHPAAAVERDPEVDIGPVRVRQRDQLGRLVVHRAVDDGADLVAQRDPGH